MKDLDERLAGHLQAQADQLRFSTAHVDRVIARGRRRQRRARVAASSIAALSVVAAVVGFQATRPDGPTKVKVSGDDQAATSTSVPATATSGTSAAPTTATGSTASTIAVASGVTLGGAGSAPLLQATVGGPNVSWQRKNPKSSLGGFGQFGGVVQQGNRLVALSTAPAGSPTNAQPYLIDTIYSTSDGIEWSPSSLGTNNWISSIAGNADRLYAVGTAPATVATQLKVKEGDAIAGISTDGGRTWTRVALPPNNTIPALKGTRAVSSAVALAAGGKGAIVTVAAFRQPFIADLVPAGVDTSWGVSTSPAGVSVFAKPPSGQPDPRVCSGDMPVLKRISDVPEFFTPGVEASILAQGLSPWICLGKDRSLGYLNLSFDKLGYPVDKTYSWAELGTTWQQLAGAQQTTTTVYSADGASYEPVTLPASAPEYGGAYVAADADGFVAVVNGQPGQLGQPGPAGDLSTVAPSVPTMQTFRSTDGRTWTPGAPMNVGFGGAPPVRLGDGRWVMVSQGGPTPVLLTSDDALTWQARGLNDVVASAVGPTRQGGVGAVDVGPKGITITVNAYPDPIAESGGVMVRNNGITITITNSNNAAVVTDDGTGAVLGTTASLYNGDTPVLHVENGVPGSGVGTVAPTTVADCPPGQPEGCIRPQAQPPVYVVVDPATGAERARFTADEIQSALAPVYNKQAVYDPRAFVATSVDGITWAVTDVSDAAGEPISYIVGIDHLGDKVIVRAQTKRTVVGIKLQDGVQAFVQLALVGTFTG